MENVYSVIIKPVVTEKASVAQARGQYTFLVSKDATKVDIKKAVKELYGVEVSKVQVLVTPRKVRLLRGRYEMIKRPNQKKAVVTLKGKETIDPNKLTFAKKDKK